MKKLLVAALLLISITANLQALPSDVRGTTDFSSTGSGNVIIQIGAGIGHHRISWNPTGTVSTCQVKLQQSVDSINWTDLIANQTCTSSGTSSITTGVANYVRIMLGTFSGGGALRARYDGWIDRSAGGGGGSGDALTTNPLSQFASTTSAQLAGVISNETGTSLLVYNTSPTLVTPTLGTPASVTLTNATGLPISTGVSGLGTGVATFLGTPSSANLASAVTNETGSGALVFGTSPSFTTPDLGTPSAMVATNASGTALNLTAGGTKYVSPGSDDTYSGTSISLTAAETTAQWDVGYINSSSKVALGDADAIATSGVVVIATASVATDATGVYLLHGIARNDGWSWTPGGLLYLSTTTGAITQTAPSGTDDVIQILGVAITSKIIFWNPSLVMVVHV